MFMSVTSILQQSQHIYSFNKYLSTYYGPSTSVNKKDKNPCLHGVCILVVFLSQYVNKNLHSRSDELVCHQKRLPPKQLPNTLQKVFL